MNEQFKAGDEVYCPRKSFSIFTLTATNDKEEFTLSDNLDNTYTDTGFYSTSDETTSLFRATPENKALLEALYKCEFESPKLKGSDLTRKLLSEGKHVLCYVANSSDEAASTSGNSQVIIDCSTHSLGEWQFESSVDFWLYAVPCNDYANLVDGVLTLKSEQ